MWIFFFCFMVPLLSKKRMICLVWPNILYWFTEIKNKYVAHRILWGYQQLVLMESDTIRDAKYYSLVGLQWEDG